MDLGLEGAVAIVTGVSRGIGAVTAALLVDEGERVVGVSRTPPGTPTPGVLYLSGDITHAAVPERVVERTLSDYGRLDVLVNNAGTGLIRRGYADVSDSQWGETWELLFLSVVRMSNAALPALLASDQGVIVNVSTRNARVPVPSVPDYSAAKAALTNYSKGIAREYAGQGLRVVSVSPGPTATPLWLGPQGAAVQAAALEGKDAAAILQDTEQGMPHGRMVRPEEVADLIVYLASARAGSVSGIDVLIDAGLTQTI
jgi:NAD(P)-dependent dehydrogenase (short-subunit alcohol dehydrogenase family)